MSTVFQMNYVGGEDDTAIGVGVCPGCEQIHVGAIGPDGERVQVNLSRYAALQFAELLANVTKVDVDQLKGDVSAQLSELLKP